MHRYGVPTYGRYITLRTSPTPAAGVPAVDMYQKNADGMLFLHRVQVSPIHLSKGKPPPVTNASFAVRRVGEEDPYD